LRTLVAGALATTGLVLVGPWAQAAEPGGCAPAAAHRGILTSHTENTKGSMRSAIAADAEFEIDLRSTSNDGIVVIHDSTLSRTTNGSGRVANKTAAKIRSLRTDDGQRVPVIGGVLRMVRDNSNAKAILHLKTLTPTSQRKLASLIAEYGIARRLEAIGNASQLAGFRRRNPGTATYLLSPGLPSVDEAAASGGAHVFPRLTTPKWRADMQSEGVPFNTRLDDTPEGWETAQVGTTSVMTDDVAGYRAYCSSRA